MKTILVTGGTVFVSKYIAGYFIRKGHRVYVLNRGNHPQPKGAIFIKADRARLTEELKDLAFDAVLDVTAYTQEDIRHLLGALGDFGDYVMISSSAVYPETLAQPFCEDQPTGKNKFWGTYGTDKISAEQALFERVPNAYILRPPYLYGPMNNVYREAFAFDCAMQDRRFYLPGDGQMKLQFFHVEDLCRVIEAVLEKKPEQHVLNVGNETPVTIREWAELCYAAAGKKADFVSVYGEREQRDYFCFYDYEYVLDVTRQKALLPKTRPLLEGLSESYAWYRGHQEQVGKRPYLEYIDRSIR